MEHGRAQALGHQGTKCTNLQQNPQDTPNITAVSLLELVRIGEPDLAALKAVLTQNRQILGQEIGQIRS